MMETMLTMLEQKEEEIKLLKQQSNVAKFNEIEEYNRQHEVVVSGLPEDRNESCSIRAQNDKSTINKLLDLLEIEATPVTVYRMGKMDTNRPRLVKVRMPTRRMAMEMRNAAAKGKIRTSENFKGVKIRESMSRADLDLRRTMMNQCKAMNEKEPEKKYVIYANQIVEKSKITAQWKATLNV